MIMNKQHDINALTINVLFLEFGCQVLIPLEALSERYLNMSIATAKRRAKSGDLPFPATKMGENQKSSYFVHINHFAKFVDERCSAAKIDWDNRKT